MSTADFAILPSSWYLSGSNGIPIGKIEAHAGVPSRNRRAAATIVVRLTGVPPGNSPSRFLRRKNPHLLEKREVGPAPRQCCEPLPVAWGRREDPAAQSV